MQKVYKKQNILTYVSMHGYGSVLSADISQIVTQAHFSKSLLAKEFSFLSANKLRPVCFFFSNNIYSIVKKSVLPGEQMDTHLLYVRILNMYKDSEKYIISLTFWKCALHQKKNCQRTIGL